MYKMLALSNNPTEEKNRWIFHILIKHKLIWVKFRSVLQRYLPLKRGMKFKEITIKRMGIL